MMSESDPNHGSMTRIGEDVALAELGLPEKSLDNEEEGGQAKPAMSSKKLSVVSSMYDREKKGYLDSTQQMMRDMDTSNRGFVTNEKVYDMLKAQMDMQSKMFNMKRIIIVLAVLVVLLAVAMLGLSFAAATLAKDTQVNDQDSYVNKANGHAVATANQANVYEINPKSERRMRAASSGDGRKISETSVTVTYPNAFSVGLARQMYADCVNGHTVKISWTEGTTTNTVTVCPRFQEQKFSNSPFIARYFTTGLSQTMVKVDCSAGAGCDLYLAPGVGDQVSGATTEPQCPDDVFEPGASCVTCTADVATGLSVCTPAASCITGTYTICGSTFSAGDCSCDESTETWICSTVSYPVPPEECTPGNLDACADGDFPDYSGSDTPTTCDSGGYCCP